MDCLRKATGAATGEDAQGMFFVVKPARRVRAA